jgi:SOS-response transcriptional repressor LexA
MRIAEGDKNVPGLEPETYHLQEREKLSEAITRSWNRLIGFWSAFQSASASLKESDAAIGLTRDKWLLPLFQELAYGRLPAGSGFEIEGKRYPISHVWQNTPIHLLGRNVDLDRPTKGVAGAARHSPHGLVQEFLNRHDGHLWGFLSNGLKLRILRDNKSLTRQAYVEFDLAGMMEGQVYSDFAILWLLCHESRVEAARANECWLEKWTDTARERGTRALEDLRAGVEQAIRALGRGFLAHPANRGLVDRLRKGALDKQDYYRQLLRTVYRLIFLFVAEDRDLLLTAAHGSQERDRYLRHYSMSHLRTLAERRRGSPHSDLWQGLRLVFAKLSSDSGCTELGLSALGSFLWSDKATPDIDGSELANTDLLAAIRSLAFTLDGKIHRTIDYRNLGAEELGSVYESLLELHAEVNADAPTFDLKIAAGHERKTTGSYYTPTSLIECLLDSALDPILQEAANQPDPEKAILDLKVCDPACGSGHFLIAAAHRMANGLAAVRTGDEEPSPGAVRKALRDVVGRCLYGVDINPMAVELCKVNLWLEALEPGKPLSFLEHHIQCGNSLLGTTPALIRKGIPDEAFEPLEGDDKAICRIFKKKNRAERDAGQGSLLEAMHEPWARLGDLATAVADLDEIPDDTVGSQRVKQDRWEQLVRSNIYESGRLWADAWCAAFVWMKVDDPNLPYPITEAVFRRIERDPLSVAGRMREEIRRFASDYQFFHWHIGFPTVFGVPRSQEEGAGHGAGWSGGFDVVVGNPPWDKIQPEEQKFFAGLRPDIAGIPKASERKGAIERLSTEAPEVYRLWMRHRRWIDGVGHLTKNGGVFPLSSEGNLNTYRLFAELSALLVGPAGIAGLIVQSGLATDETGRHLFASLVNTRRLRLFLDFENRLGLFPAVDSRFRFALVVISGDRRAAHDAARPLFGFLLQDVAELSEPGRLIELTADDLHLFNPLSLTAPVFLSKRDLNVQRGIYSRSVHILVSEGDRLADIRFLGELYNMTRDSRFFLAADYRDPSGGYVPLYEAKNLNQFDHRFAGLQEKRFGEYDDRTKQDPAVSLAPRSYVAEGDVQHRLAKQRFTNAWMCGFRDVARSTDERTAIFAIFPRSAVGNSINLVLGLSAEQALWFVANGNSFAFDFACRAKVGGMHVNIWIMSQLPALPLSAYEEKASWSGGTVGDWITARALELTYTAYDLAPFAREIGYEGAPFRWDRERRFRLRCELDAAFFYLYGIERPDVEYILDSFPIARANDDRTFGTFRTKQQILDSFDEVRGAKTFVAAPQVVVAQPVVRGEAVGHVKSAVARTGDEPFQRVRPRYEERHTVAVPLVSLKVAAGAFSVDQAPEFQNWVRPRTDTPLAKGLFVAQVLGRSMEPEIPNGAYCLFRRMWTTPRGGSVVIVERHGANDPELGGSYTVKRFRQDVHQFPDGTRHVKSVLEPANPAFSAIVFDEDQDSSVRVIAELVEVLQ